METTKESNIMLSEKYGVNPCLTICPRCGGELNEILLIGKAFEYECEQCHAITIGKYPSACPFCTSSRGFINKGSLMDQAEKCPEQRFAINAK